MANKQELSLEKLKNDNFNVWQLKMKILLKSKGLWSVVESNLDSVCQQSSKKAEELAVLREQLKQKDEQALCLVVMAIDDQQLVNIQLAETTNANNAWNKISEYYQRKSLASKSFLKRRFLNMKFSDDGNFEEHLTDFSKLYMDLSAVGSKPTEDEYMIALLNSMPDSYSSVVTSLESQTSGMTVEFIIERLRHAWIKRNQNKPEENQSAFYAKRVNTKEKYQKNEKSQPPKCYICNKPGHKAKNCWHRNKPWNKSKQKRESSPHASFLAEEFDHQVKKTDWYLDSGASTHMTDRKEVLRKFYAFKEPKRIMTAENGRILNAIGSGEVYFRLKGLCGYKTIKLTEVFFVPELGQSLVSVNKITASGGKVIFSKNEFALYTKDDLKLTSGTKLGNSYILNGYPEVCSEESANLASEIDINTWHKRLGHSNFETTKSMCEQKSIKLAGLKQFCDACASAKIHRLPFPRVNERRTSAILDLIHSDIVGPITPESRGGNRYFATFIDDHSRFSTIYTIKSKDQILESFKTFYQHVKNMFNKSIRAIRTDNGREYVSTAFSEFCIQHGIEHQHTVPYCPQQNGIAERKNRTLVESARSLLIDANVAKTFWAEAAHCANYVQNRLMNSAIDNKIPIELWLSRPCSIKHLRVFGSEVFALIPEATRKSKFDSKGEKCIFVGYDIKSCGYRLFSKVKNKIFVAKHVIFNEVKLANQSNIESKANTKNQESETLTISGITDEVVVDEKVESISLQDSVFEPAPVLRRSNRQRKPNQYYSACVANIIEEPTTIFEALQSKQAKEWLTAAECEINAHTKNKTWLLVRRPDEQNVIGSRWVFKVKYKANNEVDKFRARIVAKGFNQVKGVDYTDSYSPVIRQQTVRMLYSIVVNKNWSLHHMDVKTAFLNGDLHETVFMEQPDYFATDKQNFVCHLQKSIYGLKQSAKSWNSKLTDFLVENGFKAMYSDECLFYLNMVDHVALIAIYIDDVLITASHLDHITKVKQMLSKRFEMVDLGEISYFLGMEVRCTSSNLIQLKQETYLVNILSKLGMKDCKPANIPCEANHKTVETDELHQFEDYRSAVGSLMYLMVSSRPELAFIIGHLSQHLENPMKDHYLLLKRVLRYVKGTQSYCLHFESSKTEHLVLQAFSDASWGSDEFDRKSITGYAIFLNKCLISWKSQKQPLVALSSAEAELIALAATVQEVLFLRSLLAEIGFAQTEPTMIHVDNQAVISMCTNRSNNSRIRHLDIRYYFVKDCIQNKSVILEYLPSSQMTADIFTKPLPFPSFARHRNDLGVRDPGV